LVSAPRPCWRASIASVYRSLVWVLIFGSVFAGFSLPRSVFAATEPSRQKNSVAARNGSQAAQNNYVGSAACARCHQDIYQSFSRTRMGRSMTLVTPAVIRALSLPGTISSELLDRHYDVFSRSGHLFQSESQKSADGADAFRNTQQLEWILGAGANGFGAIVRRGNYLFEAPLSFYEKTQKWELSPGFEANDLGFTRPILAGCISCHSGRPNPADQTSGKFETVPFSQLAIGCENCHGPGEAHVRGESLHIGNLHGSRIVNPDRLTADLENNICMSCHEGGDSRVLQPGKSFKDFRPGEPLDDTFSILMVPLKRNDPDNEDHVHHYFEMSMSKCFRSSAGQLRCATCHDPHVEPSKAEAPEYFNAKCMGCHASRACTLSVPARQQTTPPDNCIGCHMPRREASETAHTSLTNHRILIRPGEPWPDEAFEQTTPGLPDQVHLNRVPGRSDDPPAIVLLEAYREIAERKPEYLPAYEKTLSELEQTEPDRAVVQLALGRRDFKSGDLRQAILHLQRAVQLDPQQAQAYSYLSEALAQTNRVEEAIAASEKAVSLDPYNSLYQKALIDQMVAAKQYEKALGAMEHYLELFPEDTFMRDMLKLAKQ